MSQYLTKVHVDRGVREMDGQPALAYTGVVYDAEQVRVTPGSMLNNDAIVTKTRPFKRSAPRRSEPGQQPDLQAGWPAQGLPQGSGSVTPKPETGPHRLGLRRQEGQHRAGPKQGQSQCRNS